MDIYFRLWRSLAVGAKSARGVHYQEFGVLRGSACLLARNQARH